MVQDNLNPALTIRRLTRVVDVIRIWSFFKEGIEYEAKYLRYSHSLDVYRRILFHLVYKNPNAWVGVAFAHDDLQQPVAFIMSHDVTPIYAEKREFEVSMFYFKKGFKYSINLLQDSLDTFCKQQGVTCYYLTTASFSSSAQRVFKDVWHGLQRSNTVFKRKLVK